MTALFIVGAPRSGSTLLYQAVTNSYDVLYPDNLASLFGRHVCAGITTSRRVFGARPHNCFCSTRGRTWTCGLHSPNELERVFTNALPHGWARGSVSDALQTLACEIGRAMRTYERPLVFKALRVGQHIVAMRQALPDARFVFIRRDPLLTAQSMILARREERADPALPWYLPPRDDRALAGLSGARMVVKQIHLIEQEIARELALLPAAAHTTVWYHELCADVHGTMERLTPLLPDVRHRSAHATPEHFRRSEAQRLPDREFQELRQCVTELDWMFAND